MNYIGVKKAGAVRHAVRLAAVWCAAAVPVAAALAQDVPGLEICTQESRMDRRTGCLQSNVEFLQKVITKNALDAQQKLTAAGREITGLREQLAAAGRESAGLKETITALEARLAKLEKAAPPAPDAKK
jgi:hypothetical protein